ncbi:hypothetical protein AK812_SmicGene18242 [Symbiodinium microadriaticum]|uniref:Uncharacterized protein n=1 Tax=Symbiodinium microadriaticum TaxID=2951 RepID=A0A1Q9DVM5_SYMMI|nr:hypothetical protein AK812_SmicGene18242 [Symbiodinium microadriaticum]CAE7908808.1 unnamed protein product [Symbiodinium sp. KB8]
MTAAVHGSAHLGVGALQIAPELQTAEAEVSLQRFRKHGDVQTEAAVAALRQAAQLAWSTRRLEEGLRAADEARQLLQERRDREGELEFLSWTICALRRRRNEAEAMRFARRRLELYRQMQMLPQVASSLCEIAELSLALDEGPFNVVEGMCWPGERCSGMVLGYAWLGPPGSGGDMQTDLNAVEGASPQKRRAAEQPAPNLSLDAIREAIRGEVQTALGGVREDLRTFAGRVDHVENQVTQKMQQTINLLEDMTGKYTAHGEILKQLQEANREFQTRLETLEKNGGGAGSTTAGSTIGQPSDGGRQPALVIGGWSPDQDARETRQAAEDILRSVEAPIDLGGMFVPGIRRGYAILPINEPPGESAEARRARVQDVISRVRAANVQLGTRQDGGIRKVWIAISQPPEKRRRARLAAKVKRLYLTLGGDKNNLEMEYSSGSAWVTKGGQSVKVCSATASRPPGGEEAGPGWVDLGAIAQALRCTKDAVAKEWSPLKAEIN